MKRDSIVLLRCRIGHGAFFGEWSYRVTMPDGSDYRGGSSTPYLYRDVKVPIGDLNPDRGEWIDGLVVGQVVDFDGNGRIARLHVPMGDAIDVREDQVAYRVQNEPV